MKQRENWSSRLGYVLTVAGATIGFGATWRFPYLVGENGGGAYVLVFIIVMFLVGIPVILVENIIGRRLQVNSIDAYSGEVGNKPISKKWNILGYMGVLGAFGIMAYYMVLGGWVITYIVNIFSGNLDLSSPINKEIALDFFNKNIYNNTSTILIYTFIFAALNFIILAKGIINGIEKAMTILMPTLFILVIIMVIRNVTLLGSMEGIIFYLKPDLSKITPKLFVFVLGQVFFALSLGFGVLITLSSYLSKKENMIETAIITGIVNTVIAVLAGFMIFPSLFAFGLDPASGPSLVFQVLPIVFSNMWFGNGFAILFFTLLLVAALTSSLPIYEVLNTIIQEKLHVTRKKAIAISILVIYILGNIPSILGFTEWSNIKFLGGKNIFDTFDYISGNIFFVLTALGSVLFVGWCLKKDAIKEITNNGELNTPFVKGFVKIWYPYIKYIVPLLIFIIFLSNFI